MLLKYRGTPYRPYFSSVQYCVPMLRAIALNYRGTSYLVERPARDHQSHS
jgi:hypothetical protein